MNKKKAARWRTCGKRKYHPDSRVESSQIIARRNVINWCNAPTHDTGTSLVRETLHRDCVPSFFLSFSRWMLMFVVVIINIIDLLSTTWVQFSVLRLFVGQTLLLLLLANGRPFLKSFTLPTFFLLFIHVFESKSELSPSLVTSFFLSFFFDWSPKWLAFEFEGI